MKPLGFIAALLAMLAIGSAIYLAVDVSAMQTQDLPQLFFSARIVVQMVDLVLAFWVVGVVVISVVARTPSSRPAYMAMAGALVFFGAAGCLYGMFDVWRAATVTHTTRLDIVGPDIANSLVPLSLGLALAAAALIAAPRKARPV